MLEGLLTYARVGTMHRAVEPIALAQVVGQVLADLTASIEQRGAEVTSRRCGSRWRRSNCAPTGTRCRGATHPGGVATERHHHGGLRAERTKRSADPRSRAAVSSSQRSRYPSKDRPLTAWNVSSPRPEITGK